MTLPDCGKAKDRSWLAEFPQSHPALKYSTVLLDADEDGRVSRLVSIRGGQDNVPAE
ncbi:MAG: hypothetical protein ACRD3S_19575 [Terracidiphilus sp.]